MPPRLHVPVLLATTAALLVLAIPVPAQELTCPPSAPSCEDPPPSDQPPVVTLTPAAGTYGTAFRPVEIEWVADQALRAESRLVRLNGSDVTALFSYGGSASWAQSAGIIRLDPGTNTVEASICSGVQCTTATATYLYQPPPAPGLSRLHSVGVTPGAAAATVQAGALVSQTFTVTNTGDTAAVYLGDVVCSGTFTGCSRTPASLALGAGASGTFTVSAVAGRAGTSLGIRFTARHQVLTEVRAEGTVTASVAVAPGPHPPILSLAGLNPSTTVSRGHCLTVSLGGGTAYECGDLRAVHPLPVTRTLNHARGPVLLYNSAHGYPLTHVSADVRIPPGATLPDSITGTLRVNGSVRKANAWPGSQWSSGEARRVALFATTALASGAYPYTFEVKAWYGASAYPVSVTDTLLVVDRRFSRFGPGWWLAGLEQLVLPQMVWVGGDGSARRYRPAGTNVWKPDPFDGSDSLTFDPAAGEYSRHLGGGARVVFDPTGRHVRTVDRHGYATDFEYRAPGSRVLRYLRLPAPVNAARPFYEFHYTADSLLWKVTAPPLENRSRETLIAWDPSLRQLAITDPDSQSVVFGYHATAGQIHWRRDRRQTVTTYSFNSARLATVRRHMAGGTATSAADVVHVFTPAELRGANGSASVDTARAYTRINGPRTGPADTLLVWTDRWGGVRRLRGALGAETRVFRENGAYPAVVTRSLAPNGYERRAELDGLGRLVRVVGVNSLGDGRNDTTAYAYEDPAFPDFVTWARGPEGEVARTGYDGFGRVAWTQPGDDPVRRAVFTYHEPGSSVTPHLPLSASEPGGAPTFFAYDSLRGNLRSVTAPLTGTATIHTDGVGRPTLTYSPIQPGLWEESHTEYSVMDQVVASWRVGPGMHQRPGAAVRVENGYDEEGNLTHVARVMSPDPDHITVAPDGTRRMVITMGYDRANRKILEFAPDGYRDSTVYDPASNVVEVHPRHPGTVTMTYDVLNRMVRRVTTGESLTDVSRFSYDGMGNLLSATNDNARVTRSYLPNGLVRTDSSRIRTDTRSHVDTLWTGYTAYVYGMRYEYDRAGRRTTVVYPANLLTPTLLPLRDRVRYGYDPVTGALAWLEGLGTYTRFDYRYDLAGRPDTTYMPGNVTEWYAYDAAGRLSHRHALAPGGGPVPGGYLRADTLSYDQRNKLVEGNSFSMSMGRVFGSNFYDGLGHLVGTYRWPSGFQNEGWAMDALGNRTATSSQPWGEWMRNHVHELEPGTGRLLRRMTPLVHPDTVFFGDTVVYNYDVAGNLRSTEERGKSIYNDNAVLRQQGHPEWYQRIVTTYSYIRGDGRMHTHLRYSNLQMGAPVNLREEYAYDALGRRVWRRAVAGFHPGNPTQRDSVCQRAGISSECASIAERTIWDGDQVLAELREDGAPGYQSTNFATLFGRVLYTHAGGIDQPSEVVRIGSGGHFDFAIVPHTDWQGMVDVVTFTGPRYGECGPHIGKQIGNMQECYPFELTARGAYGDLPQPDRTIADPGPRSWSGSLLEGSRDLSGLMYRRNRYMDPRNGTFTQEDPIGLAGGLNLYGFGNGDPITYSDPYGLCPPEDNNYSDCPGFFTVLGAGTGALLGGLSGGAAGGVGGMALCSPGGPLAAGCGAAGAAAGGTFGAGKGALIGGAAGAFLDGLVHFADAGRGRGGNRVPNREVRRIARENNLNEEGRRALHDEITGQEFTRSQIREIAEELAQQSKYLRSSQ